MQVRPPWSDPETPREQRGHGLRALILGVGPVGLLGAMALVSSGFETYVYSREVPPSPRTDLVARLGATYISSQACSFDELALQIGNIDLMYEAVGQSHFALQALDVLGTNGIYVMTGVPGFQDVVEIDSARTMREMVLRNQLLLGTVNAGSEAFISALEDIGRFTRRWPDITRTLIARRHSPEEAFGLIFQRPQGIKTVISFDA
jgi:glucose 1-dehydrogenase